MNNKKFKSRLAYLLAAGIVTGSVGYVHNENLYANEYMDVQSSEILTVTEAIEKAEGQDYVKGYIVGWGNDGKFALGNEGATDGVIIIADSLDETDTKKMMAIKLSAQHKSEWGLGSNPNLLGAQIVVAGTNEKYYGGRGIKTITDIELVEGAISYVITANPTPGKIAVDTVVSLGVTTSSNLTILYKTNHDDSYREYNDSTGITISQDTVITAKLEDSSLSNEEFSFAYETVDLEKITIEDIRNGSHGTVSFKGIVTRLEENSSKNGLYVQDATGGMYVYEVVGGDKVVEGDEVLVQGTLTSYKDLLEVTGATVTKVDEPTLEKIEPQEITIEQYHASPDQYESELLLFKDITIGDINYSGNTTIADGTGETVVHKMAEGVEEGYDKYDLIALGSRYSDTYQLSVVSPQDVIPTEGVEQVGDIVLKEGNELVLPESVEVIQDGIRGQETIIWNQEDLLKIDINKVGSYELRYTVLGKAYSIQVTIVSAEGVKISDIQGKSHTSPLKGQQVAEVQGVITAIDGKYGFYMQDPNPDHDEATSDAIYVEAYNHGFKVGTLVEVSGMVAEEIGYTTNTSSDASVQLTVTQITASIVGQVEADVELPAAVVIGENGRMPEVSDIIDNDNFAEFDPEEDFIDFYESLEGMLIEIQDAQVVGGNKYDEIPVVPDRGKHSSNGLSSQGGVVVSENTMHPEILALAKGMNTAQPTVMVGDVFSGSVQGILTYNDGNYKVAVSKALPEIEEHTYNPDVASTLKETENGLRIASFNVENLGGDGKQSKINSIAEVIVDKLHAPDIIGLQEVQDNSGTTDNGVVEADMVYQRIIAAINAINPELNYDYVEIAPENNQDGGAPGGNIRVGMIYRTDRVEMVEQEAGDTATAVEVVKNEDGSAGLSINPGRIEPQNSVFSSTRKSLAVEFIFKGERVIVINNHLSSKGGDTPLFGNVQPADLQSEVKRIEQAKVVNHFIQEILAVDSKAKIVTLGDMNDYYFSNPVKVLAGSELYNMHLSLPETERYTYSYQGKSQVLDNILVTKGLEAYTEIEILHSNSSRAKTQQLSDHDPMMIRINMDQIQDKPSQGGDNDDSSDDDSTTVPEGGTGGSNGAGGSNSGNHSGNNSNANNGNTSEDSSSNDSVIKVNFTDVTKHWAQKDIEYLASRGLLAGIGDNVFAPNKGMKACDFKTLLSRVYEGDISLGSLQDGQLLTRAQLAVIVKNSIGINEKVDTVKLISQFKDVKGLSSEETEALAYMYQEGVLRGVSETKMSPQSQVTRAQAATIIVRLLDKLEK